jgi:hypothetical protein
MTPSQRLKQLHALGRLDVQIIQDQIKQLLFTQPELELAEDEILRADMIEGETDAFEFLGKLVRLVGDAKTLELGIETYIAELRARKDRFERRQMTLRMLIFKVMEIAQLTKAELPEATLSVRQAPRKVIIVDEMEIPDEYLRIVSAPDKLKIKEALVNNQDVPGAMLSNAEPVLAIHTK